MPMNRTLICIVALLGLIGVAMASGYHPSVNKLSFEEFLSENQRDYAMSNDRFALEARRIIFETNMKTIRQHNTLYELGMETWFMRPNQFTDKTESEWKAFYLGYDQSGVTDHPSRRRGHRLQSMASSLKLNEPFTPIDWSDSMSPVISQGSCGSCWANAAANCFSGRANIELGQKTEYVSRQFITACTDNSHHCGGTGGCQGSVAQLAFQHIKKNGGIPTEANYPYTAGGGSTGECKESQHTNSYTFDKMIEVLPNNRTALFQALKTGPVSISAAASKWSFYGGGVFSGSKCDDLEVNHAIVLVGVGVENGKYFYKIMNSWGSSWGEKGYIRVFMADPNVDEACGVDPDPMSGSACEDDPSPRSWACGCNGVLFDSVYVSGIKKL